jgi:hypothetical protein
MHLPAWLGWFAMFLFFVFGRTLAIDSDADRLVVRLIGFLNPENYVLHVTFGRFYEKFEPFEHEGTVG